MDRNYYGMCTDADLIARAKEGRDELAIVLAERLADANFCIENADREEIKDLEREIEDLKDDLEEAKSTIRFLEHDIAAMENNK